MGNSLSLSHISFSSDFFIFVFFILARGSDLSREITADAKGRSETILCPANTNSSELGNNYLSGLLEIRELENCDGFFSF